MNKSRLRLLTSILLLLMVPYLLSALTIKLASPLPEGTEWDNSLRRMADEWREITGGRVSVRIYPGGIAGDEADMVRKMRLGQIDVGIFSAFGLKMMVPETFVLTLPGLLQNDTELEYIIDNYVQRFDDRFREEGFEILAWSKSGWAYIFGREPIRSPDDLRKGSIVINDSDSDVSAVYKTLGFHVVQVSINETMVALQSGMVDIFTAPPIVAGAFQWFAMAPYMTDFPLTPVVGGLVISERSWLRIPEQFHDELRVSMNRVGKDFYAESLRLNDEALRVMLDNGLQLVDLDEESRNVFKAIMAGGHEQMIGKNKMIPRWIYDDLQKELNNLRK